MHHKIVGVDDGTSVAAEGAHDHPVLVEDAGVLALALVRVAERHGGRLDERGVRADCEETEPARRRLNGWQGRPSLSITRGWSSRILATG